MESQNSLSRLSVTQDSLGDFFCLRTNDILCRNGAIDKKDIKKCLQEMNSDKRPLIIEVWRAMKTTIPRLMTSINMPGKRENPFLFTFQPVEPDSKDRRVLNEPEQQQNPKSNNSSLISPVDIEGTTLQQGDTTNDNAEQELSYDNVVNRGELDDMKSLPVTSSHFNADFDGFYVESLKGVDIARAILPTHIPIELAGKTGERSTSKYNDYLCCALKPYHIYVDKKHKSAILDKIQVIRNVAHPPHDSTSALLKLSITMSSRQFNNILH